MHTSDICQTYLGSCNQLPNDAAQRMEALTVDQSYLVKAPAGSGKTELLAQRFLGLMSTVDNPEDILAITFTKKAGAEMKTRIVNALANAQTGSEPEMGHSWLTWALAKAALERSEEKGWAILDNTGRLRIRTIDAFYGSIARSAPLASLMGGGNKIADDPDHCYSLAAQDLLGDLEADNEWTPALESILRHCDNRFDRTEELLVSLLAQREHWLPIVLEAGSTENVREELERTLQIIAGEYSAKIERALSPYWPEIQELVAFAGTHLDPDADTDYASLGNSDGIASLNPEGLSALRYFLLTSDGSPRKSATAAIGFPAPSKASNKDDKALFTDMKGRFKALLDDIAVDGEARDALAKLDVAPPSAYTDKQWDLLSNLFALLPILAAKLVLVFQREGVVDHSEIAASALRVLGQADNPSELSLILDYQLRHILIDEFQDTNSLQMEGLRRITAGWERGDGRSLFLVGDPQQSIYGFRGSNVGLFVDVENHGVGDISLNMVALLSNFRSSPAVVDWVNQTFAGVFPANQDANLGAISYSPAVAGNTTLAGNGVQCVAFAGERDEARTHEGQWIAQQVAAIRDSHPEDTIGILVRSRPHLVNVLEALRHRDIPFQSIDIDPLKERACIRDLTSLTRAICHIGDRTAWLSLLRSPMVGLPLNELEIVATAAKKRTILHALRDDAVLASLSGKSKEQVEAFTTVLSQTEWLRERKPLCTLVEGAWIALHGPAALSDPSDLQNAQAFFKLVKNLDFGSFDIERFNAALDRLYALPYTAAKNAVQVMTIHKSKGLEFDHVFIPACERTSRSNDTSLLVWDRHTVGGEEKALLSASPELGSHDNDLYTYIRNQESDRGNLESQRILYVGCTRARKSLAVTAALGADGGETGSVKSPPANSFMGALWPVVEQETEVVVAAPADEPGQFSRQTAGKLEYIPQSHAFPEFERGDALAAYRGRIELNKEDIPNLTWRVDYERQIGEVAHWVLAFLATTEAHGMKGKLHTFKQAWTSQLQQLGVPAYYCPTAVNLLADWIGKILDDATGSWLLDSNHRDSSAELELFSMDAGKLRKNIIDRTFVHDDVRWVIDYKLGEIQKGESDSDYQARIISEYSEQLQHYGLLAGELGNEPVKTAVYCIATQRLIDIEATGDTLESDAA